MMRIIALIVLTACSTTTTDTPIDRTDCYTCHSAAYASTPDVVGACTPTDHTNNPTTCASCHGLTSWCPAIDPTKDAHTKFKLTSTSHAGLDCADCHTAITYAPPLVVDQTQNGIDCTNCHSHDRAQTDPHHTGKSDYVYGPNTCLAPQCHGNGRQ